MEKSEKSDQKREPKFGFGYILIYIFFVVAALLYLLFRLIPAFADGFNYSVGAVVRYILSIITSIFPFSIAEICLYLIIPAAIVICVIATKRYCGSWRALLIFLGKIFAVVAMSFILFVFSFASGYGGTPLDGKLGLERKNLSVDELKSVSTILVERINELSPGIEYGEDGFSVMPYDFNEMNARLLAAYDKVAAEYDCIYNIPSRAKKVIASELMTYTHMAGIYSYITGETNINVVMPDYTLPYTTAHEMAHQRGFSREDEANFIAFLVCINSDDPYIRYSGYVSMFEYFVSPYYSADTSEDHKDFYSVYWSADLNVRLEQKAYSEFFQKYKDNVAADISGAVNDTYLKANGNKGEVSYGLVVELCAAYYAK